MKNVSKHYSSDELDAHYRRWLDESWSEERLIRKSPPKTQLIKLIRCELDQLKEMTSEDYELFHKWEELQSFKGKHSNTRLDQVYKRIWNADGYSDFRRIEPELVFVKDKIKSKSVDIWGNISELEYSIPDPVAEDWDILRVLVSRHRNAGVIGKQHRYLIRDKGTYKYLGVICISVDMLEPAGRDQIIGWSKDQKALTQPHCANGSSIIPLSPFSAAYNGGKLMSLLCLSDEVAKRWEADRGRDGKSYRLVHVMTTSLFGNSSKQTMYDNLEPYWMRASTETSGHTAYEFSNKLEQNCLDWLFINEPRIFFDHMRAKKRDGTPRVRDPKDKMLKKLLSMLGFKASDYMSGHKRGMYLAPLFENAYEFLRGEIAETALKPKFDNSVEALTCVWKFGLQKNNSGAKARLENLLRQREKTGITLPTMKQAFWYRELMGMTWEETKAKYGSKK